MSKLNLNFWLSLFGATWGLVNLAARPVVAREITAKQNDSRQLSLVSKADSISTKAKDLSSPSADEVDNIIETESIAQRKPVERPPIPLPVPVPPPAPEETSEVSRDTQSGWAIAPEISSLGLGGNLVRRISGNFNARVGVNAFGLNVDVEETDFDYDGDLNLFNVSSIIDLHPFKNSGFRISGGVIFGDNNIEGTADVSERVADELGEVEVAGQTIDIRELDIDELATVDADIDFSSNSVAPYLGIGGGNATSIGKKLGFWWNLGVVFAGSPQADVSINTSEEVPEEIRADVTSAAERALENEEQDLEDELDFLKIYPVLSLGLSYQF